MSSDDPYLHAPEIPPGCCKHGMPHKFGCDDCTIERLHAENATLTDSCAAKADRIDRLGETVERLTAEREADRAAMDDALNALVAVRAAVPDLHEYGNLAGNTLGSRVDAAISSLKARTQ